MPYYAFCYNTTPHTDFPYSPFELIFGKTAILPNNVRKPESIEPLYNYEQYYSELKFKLQTAATKTNKLLNEIKSKRNLAQQSKANPIQITINDNVMLQNENRAKLDKIYNGPFKVIDIDHPNVTLLDETTNQKHIVHKNRITIIK